MKFSSARNVGMAVGLAALVYLAAPAQTPTQAAPAATQTAPAAQPEKPLGKVIFSRSIDENGQVTTQGETAATAPKLAAAPSAEDAERQAVTFTDLDLDVHLRTAEQHLAVRALLTVRNDGAKPLTRIPLEIGSQLNWDRILVGGKGVTFTVATLNSDTDHTGQLHEAAVPLAQPLAAGASVLLDVSYAGTIASNAQRLLAVGTPEDLALHSDWDQIGVDFTGLRGFGNVVWYPVSAVPVILGDGARLFDEIGEHKLRLSGARFRLRLTVEAPHGRTPNVALINGHSVQLAVTAAGGLSDDVADIARADNGGETLGFEAPSLFLAIRTQRAGTNAAIWVVPEDVSAVPAWVAATAAVSPFLEGWLGKTPRAQLTLLDLPDPEDAPYETGALLATPIRPGSPDHLNGVLVHALTHAWMQSPRAWLSEGLATFMGTLWTERQQGREKALETLEAGRGALALFEPESPGMGAGLPLGQAISPIYYRTKAAYLFWMLRDTASDATLAAALQAYNPAADAKLGFDKNAVGSFPKLLEQAGPHRDLGWLFADWVNADKGLPDLTIESVFPATAAGGAWLVAVNVANAGYAAAEVPVTVRSRETSVTARLLVPARGKAVQRLLIQQKPTEVQVNDGTVPETQATVHVTKLEDAAEASPR